MIEYYFLFVLAGIYLIIASIEDVKKTEVANWITLSLAVFALAYRAIYAVYSKNSEFFVLGVIGFAIFYLIGNLFYYSKAFGGADVKLLRGIGVVLPYGSYKGLLFVSLEFIVVLFLTAFFYSLIYSVFLSLKNKDKLKKEFNLMFRKYRLLLVFSGLFAVVVLFVFMFLRIGMIGGLYGVFVIVMAFLFVYLKALDKCMIRLVSPRDLMEGDWTIADIKVGNKVVRNSVHGLSLKDIKILRKARKKIYVKYGIPFVPAILISFVIMVFFYLTSGFAWLLGVFGL